MKTKPTVRPRWQAAKDGVAHAALPRATRTLCGRLVAPERYAWPRENVCPECLGAVRELEGAA